MKRIFCISDTHFPVSPESESLFPRRIKRMHAHAAYQLYDRLQKGISSANYLVYGHLDAFRASTDFLIHLGDVTGGWKERGLQTQPAIDLVNDHVEKWEGVCHVFRVCLGGHDTGYSHFGSLPGGGINSESINNCRRVFRDLWWLEKCEGVWLLGLCSPIARYKGDDDVLDDLRNLQESFLHDESARINGEPWILFSHDPILPRRTRMLLRQQLPNCRAFIHGHRHDPRFTKLFRVLGTVTGNRLLRISHTCPSVAPLWWPGSGLLEITVDGTWVAIDHPYPSASTLPPEIKGLPTASFFRCLGWMLLPD